MFCFFFFFKQKTAYEMRISDWSSDVCSSDLHGQRVTELMKQKQYAPMSIADMALSLYAAERGFLTDVEIAKVGSFEQALIAYFNRDHADLMAKINVKGDFTDEIAAAMRSEEHTDDTQTLMRI